MGIKNIYQFIQDLTKLIGDKGVGLHSLTELVRLTAHQHWYVVGLGYQGDLRCAHSGHHIAIGQ